MSDVLRRNNIRLLGREDGPVVMFAHGFGCDGDIWDKMLPLFTADFRVVLFDHVGAGGSDPAAYDSVKYATLDGYAADVLEICATLELSDVTLVAHSVGGMMAVAAAAADPGRLGRIVLLASSPSYLDRPEEAYVGGFTAADIDGLLASLDANYLVWASSMAGAIMGTPTAPENAAALEASFHRVNPLVAREFSRVAFLSDVRHLLPHVSVPALILQSADDLLIPAHIGDYLQAGLADSTLVKLTATGHCPHVSSPQESADAILHYLAAGVSSPSARE